MTICYAKANTPDAQFPAKTIYIFTHPQSQYFCAIRNTLLPLYLSLLFLLTFSLSANATPPPYTNSIGMEFVFIPAGSFTMGSDKNSDGSPIDETSTRTITIDTSFYLGSHEVTQAQWQRVMGNNPSEFKGDNNPVESVSWEDAQEFIRLLNKKEETTLYRLPTEAEWEYAARAGTRSAYFFGEDASAIIFYSWYNFNSGGMSHPVGVKKANPFGLHDIQGNVSEWVGDTHGTIRHDESPTQNSADMDLREERVARGGNWSHGAIYCQSTHGFHFPPSERNSFIGLRVLRGAE